MSVLSLSLLGPFNAMLDNRPVNSFRTNKVQALLIYLAVERDRTHQRETLMALLWPDMPLESAQVNLRQTIYRLRQAIPEVSQIDHDRVLHLLETDRQTIQINPMANLHVDVDKFQSKIDVDPEEALKYYKGDFLANFYLADSNSFEEWAENIRENLRRRALLALEKLTEDYLACQEYKLAQDNAWRQLEIDGLHESAYRQLMTALAQDGQRNAALSQYQNCRKRLESKLGLDPSPETTELYNQIQAEALQLEKTETPSRKFPRPEQMPVFMLTDIEGSTRLWDIHHQAMLSALMQHNTILREQIDKYGGRILELRGDGVKAVFEKGDPLACTIAIQKELGRSDWGEIGELQIRIGLHGVPTVRKGYEYFEEDDQYYGPVLNHTARIMDSGWGGQILASEQVRNLYKLPDEAFWKDFGEHRVKSLDHPIHIFGLLHPELPHQFFPRLRTLTNQDSQAELAKDSIPHNLPQEATPFVGRKREIKEIIDLLNQPDTRLISIVGPGGMGKTRLALALAENQVQTCLPSQEGCLFPDGIYFVPLASLDDPDQIIRAIGKVINLPQDSSQSSELLDQRTQEGSDLKARLLAYLSTKMILIILDNIEHLIEGATLVSEFLESCPNLLIIVTSRERLHIREEQVFPLHGLEIPATTTATNLSDYTAMELFLQSAQRLLPNFQLRKEDMMDIVQICNLVGGMPLGLELAASWVDMLSPKSIADEIRKSLDFLETDLRNIPDRHRSVRAVFDSSWNRLNNTEKKIFSRFSLLRGGFSRTAAQEITGASIRHLSALMSKSLLSYNQATDSYHIHELLRQYGEEQLHLAPDETYETQERHSEYYCREVKRHMETYMSGQPYLAFGRIGSDIDNIQRAWNWAIQHENVKSINDAIFGLLIYYRSIWSWEEGYKICTDAVDMLSDKVSEMDKLGKDYQFTQRVFANALSWMGIHTFPFDLVRSQEHLDHSHEILTELSESGFEVRKEKAAWFFLISIVQTDLGKPDIAKKYAENCLSLSKEIGFDWMILNAHELLGDIGNMFGSPREAKNWYEKFLVESKLRKNFSYEIRALNKLGLATRHLMAYDKARSYFNDGIALARSYKIPMEEIWILQSLGFLSILLGDFYDALQHFKASVSLSERFGTPQRGLNALIHIGFSHWMLAEFEEADTVFQQVINQVKGKDENTRIFPITFHAEFLIMDGQYREACAQLEIAKSINLRLFINQFLEGRLVRNLGWVALEKKSYREAKNHFEESIRLFEINAEEEQIAWSKAGLARAEIGLGDREQAKATLIEALWTCIEMKAFIPLSFTLPIAVLYLAHEDLDLARRIYQEIRISPLLANSKFFNDIVIQHLPDEITEAPSTAANQQPDPIATLWTAASSILSNWMQLWMEEPENSLRLEKK